MAGPQVGLAQWPLTWFTTQKGQNYLGSIWQKLDESAGSLRQSQTSIRTGFDKLPPRPGEGPSSQQRLEAPKNEGSFQLNWMRRKIHRNYNWSNVFLYSLKIDRMPHGLGLNRNLTHVHIFQVLTNKSLPISRTFKVLILAAQVPER